MDFFGLKPRLQKLDRKQSFITSFLFGRKFALLLPNCSTLASGAIVKHTTYWYRALDFLAKFWQMIHKVCTNPLVAPLKL